MAGVSPRTLPAEAATPPSPARAIEPSLFAPMQPIYRLLTVAFVFAYLLVVGAFAATAGVASLLWVFLALTLNLVLLLLPFLFYRPSFGWIHPLMVRTFWIFLMGHMARTPLYAKGLDMQIALPGWDQERLTLLVAYGLLLEALSLVAYYAGFFSRLTPPVPKLRFRRPPRLQAKLLAVVFLAFLIFLVYAESRGGINSHLLSWQSEGRVEANRGSGHWIRLSRFGSFACLIWLGFMPTAYRKPIFLLAGVLSLGINFLGTGSRGSVLSILLMGLFIVVMRQRRLNPVRVAGLGVLCLMLLSSLGAMRRSLWDKKVDWGNLQVGGLVASLEHASAEMATRHGVKSSIYPILVRVPREMDHLWGSTYLTLVALPIPRAIWPGKPSTAGKLAGRIFFGSDAGIPPGAVGEAYWNFNLPGIVGVFFLFGIFQAWLARMATTYAHEPAVTVFYVIAVLRIQPSVTAMAELIFMAATVGVILVGIGVVGPLARFGTRGMGAGEQVGAQLR